MYGRFEAKIKFPNVVGAFGAFWTLGANHWIEYKSDDDESQISAYKLPQYILLNLAIGAAGGTPHQSINEMEMYVDWVRVYAPLK